MGFWEDALATSPNSPKNTCTVSFILYTFYPTFLQLGVRKRSAIGFQDWLTKARLKRQTSHVPNLMQMSKNNRFFSFA